MLVNNNNRPMDGDKYNMNSMCGVNHKMHNISIFRCIVDVLQ